MVDFDDVEPVHINMKVTWQFCWLVEVALPQAVNRRARTMSANSAFFMDTLVLLYFIHLTLEWELLFQSAGTSESFEKALLSDQFPKLTNSACYRLFAEKYFSFWGIMYILLLV
jgi:hypothetical protein